LKPVGAKFSLPIQTSPKAHPASCTVGTGSLLGDGGTVAGKWHYPPTSFSTKVKERVELYLCSPGGLSWPVVW